MNENVLSVSHNYVEMIDYNADAIFSSETICGLCRFLYATTILFIHSCSFLLSHLYTCLYSLYKLYKYENKFPLAIYIMPYVVVSILDDLPLRNVPLICNFLRCLIFSCFSIVIVNYYFIGDSSSCILLYTFVLFFIFISWC